MDNPVPVIHGGPFSREFKAFKQFVEERSSGEPLVSFEWNDYLNGEEGYKEQLYEQGQKRLDFRKWNKSDIGSGEIVKAVDSAIQLRKNTLVSWRTRDRWQQPVSDKGDLERACYALYRTDNNRETFDRLVRLLKQKYDLLAYWFFLKDRSMYLPIRPTTFDKVFNLLEVEFKTSKQCSWDNYTAYLGLMQELKELLSDRLGSEVTLLNAHSFAWVLGDSKMQKSKEEAPGASPGGEEDQQFAEARRMHRERTSFVRNRKLATAVKKRDGYKCVVCDFSSSLRYGQAHRTTALDCHHLKPLADRHENTPLHLTLEDVVTVCSNCHRVLHSDRKALSLDEARNVLVVR